MAKDSQGRKYNRIPTYIRYTKGTPTVVRAHVRSNKDKKG